MTISESNRASWMVPAALATLVALLTTAVSAGLQHMKDISEDRREVVRVRAEILKAAGDSRSLLVARLLLDHVLVPIDRAEDRHIFQKKVEDYIAGLAVETTSGSADRDILERVAPVALGDEASLVAKFSGAERLSASNALIELAHTRKRPVIDALIAAIRPEQERAAYRINLYVVFTLARLRGGWSGKPAQVARIRAFKNSVLDQDSTFRARLDDALQALNPGDELP